MEVYKELVYLMFITMCFTMPLKENMSVPVDTALGEDSHFFVYTRPAG